MSKADLSGTAELDFAALDLDYEAFRALAQNPHLDVHGRIGFPASYREGFEGAILADICAKLPALTSSENQVVIDVGPGCANLPRMLIDICAQRHHRLVLVDSEEMLAQLPDVAAVTMKVAGPYPRIADAVLDAAGGPANVLLCYSVLHYMFIETNLFDVVDATVDLLAPGGRALFGDIPNVGKRRRFFSSAAGKAHHRAFVGRDEDPKTPLAETSRGKIDDAVLAGMIQRAQAAGCDAYVLPQPAALPMANRRDDLLIARP